MNSSNDLRHNPVKFSVIVTSHNYRDYVIDAVESVLSQTIPPSQIVVIDDGSTDDSIQLLNERYGHHPLVRIVSTPNRGQLAAFCEALRWTIGDVISFLDADDLWNAEYIRTVSECFMERPSVDMVMTNLRYFGERSGVWNESKKDLDHGITSCLVSMSDEPPWIGSPTSCLSIRRNLVERLLSIPEDYHNEWRIQADDCLVIGGSILGAHKFSLASVLVNYRVHGKNRWASRKWEVISAFRLQRGKERMKNFYRTLAFGAKRPHALLIHFEFKSTDRHTLRSLWQYVLLVARADGSIETKARVMLMLAKHWLKRTRFS